MLWRCFLHGAVAENNAERLVHALAPLPGKTALSRGPPFRDSTGGFRCPTDYVSIYFARDLADIRAGIGGRLCAREVRLFPPIFHFSWAPRGPRSPPTSRSDGWLGLEARAGAAREE